MTLLVCLEAGTLPADYHDPPAPLEPSQRDLPPPPVEPAVMPAYHFSGVPGVVGLSSATAARRLEAVGLQAEVSEWRPSSRRRGTVLRQTPRAGAGAPGDDVVRLVLSTGRRPHRPAR